MTDFQIWMLAVDESCQLETGLSIYDLPDVDFRSLFDDGMTPDNAAKRAISQMYQE